MQTQTQPPAHRITAAYHQRAATHRALTASGGAAHRDAYAAELAYRFSTLAPNNPPHGDTLDQESAYLSREQTAYLLGLGVLAADFLAAAPGLGLGDMDRAKRYVSQADKAVAELIKQGASSDAPQGPRVRAAMRELGVIINDLHTAAAQLQCAGLGLAHRWIASPVQKAPKLPRRAQPRPVVHLLDALQNS